VGSDDSRAIVGSAELALLGLGQAASRKEPINPGQIVRQMEGGVEAFVNVQKKQKGLQTGFLKFDEMTGGLRPGELILLAARPAMGKTSLMLNIAQHVVLNRANPRSAIVFSLEMSRESLIERIACSIARVDYQKYRAGYINQDERDRIHDALADLWDAPLFIDDTAGTNLVDIHSKVRRMQAQHDIALVEIDYLQLLQCPKKENRVQEISALSRGLKLMAKDTKLPFLALSQLSRGPETRAGDHRPMLSDLRDGGSLEQDSDIVAFVFREEVYRPDKEALRGMAELIIAKQRNGPTGRIDLAFIGKYTKFENLARDYGTGPQGLSYEEAA
jgi:replicative DNA helicase